MASQTEGTEDQGASDKSRDQNILARTEVWEVCLHVTPKLQQ